MATKILTIPANDGGWTLAEAVTKHTNRLLLYGPPGTGKSYHAQKGTDKFYRVYLTEDTPMFELRGGPTLPDGQWQDGPCIRAWREGCRLVLDEIDKAPSEAMSFLLGILDDPETAVLTMPTGETVRPQPGFHVIATTNGGPDDLIEALKDRFTVAVKIDAPHKEAIKKLPNDLHNAARASAKAEGHRRVSIRGWHCYADLRTKIGDKAAAMAVFGERHQDVLDAFSIAALVKEKPAKAEPVGRRAVVGKCKGCGATAYAIPEVDHPWSGHPVCDAHLTAMFGVAPAFKVTAIRGKTGRSIDPENWAVGGRFHKE